MMKTRRHRIGQAILSLGAIGCGGSGTAPTDSPMDAQGGNDGSIMGDGDASPGSDTDASPGSDTDAGVPADGGIDVDPGFLACAPTLDTFSNTTEATLADNDVTVSGVTVSGVASYLWGLTSTTGLEHSFSADLEVYLVSPTGTRIALTSSNGSGFDDVFNGTVWSDTAPTPVTEYLFEDTIAAPLLAPESAMSVFTGEDPNGVWTLEVYDDSPGDTGTLRSWSMGLVTSTKIPTVSSMSFSSATVNTISDTAAVTDTITVSGMGDELCDIDIVTSITHGFLADLDIFVTAPSGTSMVLTTDNGANRTDAFDGVRWDDQANEPVSRYDFRGSATPAALTPEGALGIFRGEDPNGTWTIEIIDDAEVDDGELAGWSIEIDTCTCQ